MRFIRSLVSPVPAGSLALCAALGCDSFQLPEQKPDVEQVTLQIETVPADVGCIRITGAGVGRTITRETDVKPGASVIESFGGLPPGVVAFKAEAFATTCEPVTKSTVPSWVSEEETVNITLGRLSSVSLVLHRNGRAKVTVGFEGDPGVDAGVGTGG